MCCAKPAEIEPEFIINKALELAAAGDMDWAKSWLDSLSRRRDLPPRVLRDYHALCKLLDE